MYECIFQLKFEINRNQKFNALHRIGVNLLLEILNKRTHTRILIYIHTYTYVVQVPVLKNAWRHAPYLNGPPLKRNEIKSDQKEKIHLVPLNQDKTQPQMPASPLVQLKDVNEPHTISETEARRQKKWERKGNKNGNTTTNPKSLTFLGSHMKTKTTTQLSICYY